MNYRDMLGFFKKQPKKKVEKRVAPKPTAPPITELLKEEFGQLNEGNSMFQTWQEHVRNLDKLYLSTHHANKAIPYKKKELQKIEKYYKELKKLVKIIAGEVIDM